MKISFEGIGEWMATFPAGEDVKEGQVVMVSTSGAVCKCTAGGVFCGVARSVSRDGLAAGVQLGGMVRVAYSGESAPGIGYTKLAADGAGGVVSADGGREYMVAEVDKSAKMATIVL